ncbi:SHOCT domain-containing protein [Congregibacter litoralis]|uniref:Short C-terminal domain protein n=1 Tax=Congregibacter litoralis KT71 TaxID=314285 RepID=A4ADM6_9GAMM|nr:SHOCT domain-containing protein [Congregibacter litoralis]EAQ95915.1 Short C-terminal domain protein [Congregibacter litoralis KT71]
MEPIPKVKLQKKLRYGTQMLIPIVLFLGVVGCVSNKAIQTVQPGDDSKSCAQLKDELASLGVEFEEAKDDSGVTGKNVGLAIVFWPGIIVNEVRANKNQDSIDARISHLTGIYRGKCLDESGEVKSSERTVEQRLKELDDLKAKGLLSDEEYEDSRRRIIANIK